MVVRNETGTPADLQECTRCGAKTYDWAYEPIAHLAKNSEDYLMDYNSILCPLCYDHRCTKNEIQPRN